MLYSRTFLLGLCFSVTTALALSPIDTTSALCSPGEYLVWSQERFNVEPIVIPTSSPPLLPSANMRRASTGPTISTVYGSDWATSCKAVSTQVLCPAGEGITLQTEIGLNINSDGVCRPCAVGSYALDSVCRYCPPFTYGVNESANASPSCLPCPHIVSADFRMCIPCLQGQIPAVNAFGIAKYCVPCPAGTFKRYSDDIECRLCPAGQAAATEGNIVCDICKPGYYSGTGFVTCQPCLPGSFSGWEGASSCSSCPPGTFASDIANVYCDDCPSHSKVSSVQGMSVCAPCAPGYYEATANRTCTACPAANTSIVSTRRIHDKFAVPAFTARVGRSNSSFYTAAVCPRGVCFLVAGVDDATNTLMWSSVNLESAQMFNGSIVLAPAGTRLRGAALARAVAFFVLEHPVIENIMLANEQTIHNHTFYLIRLVMDNTCQLQDHIVQIERMDLEKKNLPCFLSGGSIALFAPGNRSAFWLSCPFGQDWALRELPIQEASRAILVHPDVPLGAVDAAILIASELCLVSQSAKTLVPVENAFEDSASPGFPRIPSFCASIPDLMSPNQTLIWMPRFGRYWELSPVQSGYVSLSAIWQVYQGCLPHEIYGTSVVYDTTGQVRACNGYASFFGTVCVQCLLTGPAQLFFGAGSLQPECIVASTPVPGVVPDLRAGDPFTYTSINPTDGCSPGFALYIPYNLCRMCEPGKYKNAWGWMNCTVCPPGHGDRGYCPSMGMNQVSYCDIGTWVSEPGALYCIGCAPGYYANCDKWVCKGILCQLFHDLCKDQCVRCSPRKYSSGKTTVCTDCPAALISNSDNTGCVSCPPGRVPLPSPQNDCIACSAGTYASGTECVACAGGSYMPYSENPGPCYLCDPGTYSSAAKSACSTCKVGTYNSNYGQALCVQCPRGKYSILPNMSTCLICTPRIDHFLVIPGNTSFVISVDDNNNTDLGPNITLQGSPYTAISIEQDEGVCVALLVSSASYIITLNIETYSWSSSGIKGPVYSPGNGTHTVSLSIVKDSVYYIVSSKNNSDVVVLSTPMSADCQVGLGAWNISRAMRLSQPGAGAAYTVCVDKDGFLAVSSKDMILCDNSSGLPVLLTTLDSSEERADIFLGIQVQEPEIFLHYVWSGDYICFISSTADNSNTHQTLRLFRKIDHIVQTLDPADTQAAIVSFCTNYVPSRKLLPIPTRLAWFPRMHEYWSISRHGVVRIDAPKQCFVQAKLQQQILHGLYYDRLGQLQECDTTENLVNFFNTRCILGCMVPNALLPGMIYDPIVQACARCKRGFFQTYLDNPYMRLCVACRPGHYCPDDGLTSELKCVPGTFTSNYASSQCQECSPGYYCPDYGMAVQKMCVLNADTTPARSVRCSSGNKWRSSTTNTGLRVEYGVAQVVLHTLSSSSRAPLMHLVAAPHQRHKALVYDDSTIITVLYSVPIISTNYINFSSHQVKHITGAALCNASASEVLWLVNGTLLTAISMNAEGVLLDAFFSVAAPYDLVAASHDCKRIVARMRGAGETTRMHVLTLEIGRQEPRVCKIDLVLPGYMVQRIIVPFDTTLMYIVSTRDTLLEPQDTRLSALSISDSFLAACLRTPPPALVCRKGFEGSVCAPCPDNTYKNTTDSMPCQKCTMGKKNEYIFAATSPDSCVCPPGTYTTQNGCTECAGDTFSAGHNASKCKMCPAGMRGAQTQCICALGHIWSQQREKCIACPFATFQDELGKQDCTPCPTNFTTLTDGATSLAACVCLEGFIGSNVGGNKICVSCPKGTYSDSRKIECVPCSPGFYGAQEAINQCAQCPRGFISGGPGAHICVPCIDGTVTNNERTKCLGIPDMHLADVFEAQFYNVETQAPGPEFHLHNTEM